MDAAETACVCTTLRMATRSVARLYDRALSPSGLRATGYAILSRLHADGSLTITQLAARLAMDRSTCTREIEPLARDGLVRVEPGADRRQRIVALSSRGRRRLAEARPHWEQVQQQVGDVLGEDRVEELRSRLRELLVASTQASAA